MITQMIADLYIRVSTDEQADRGYSQRDQEERLRRYCEINNIIIDQVVYEDHSAKNFNRPAWTILLKKLKARNSKTNLLLFTKWDRFSRNAGDAYQIISVLAKLGVDPQAIEQPLDLSIPENKMMLAIYLAAPEVENERRALNTFYGMRRAKKEGRMMGLPPFGYVNRISEDGKKKFVVPKEPASKVMQYVFEEISKEIEAPDTIRRRLAKSGVKMLSKQAFHVAIRNPIYCGRIFIEKFKDEESCFVKGLHEPLISEALFDRVQIILDGKKRISRINSENSINEYLPLRGFLICPRCGGNLTGSGSKGATSIVYYYHCRSSCGFRKNANEANQLFVKELLKYDFKPSIKEVLQKILLNNYKQITSKVSEYRSNVLKEINELNNKMSIAREKLLDDKIDDEDYQIIKSEYKKKLEKLEFKLDNSLTDKASAQTGIENKLDKALQAICNISMLYQNSSVETKRLVVSSLFPEKLTLDGNEYRTTRINTVFKCIQLTNSKLNTNKNRNNQKNIDRSCLVASSGIEPESKV